MAVSHCISLFCGKQILDDVKDALRVLSPGGTIMLHGAFPRTEKAGGPIGDTFLVDGRCESYQGLASYCPWAGEIWKAIIRLRAFRYGF